jgi:hypothetical protein
MFVRHIRAVMVDVNFHVSIEKAESDSTPPLTDKRVEPVTKVSFTLFFFFLFVPLVSFFFSRSLRYLQPG